jgi:uncharacterized RDD family membrane protein YckC
MYAQAFPDPSTDAALYEDVMPRRALAWLFDTVFIAFLVALLIPLTGFLALFFLGGLYVAVSFLYRWVGLARHSSTLGMRMVGLEFRDAQGYPMSGAQGFLHTLFYALSVAFVVPQILSVLMMVFTRRGQGLSDVVLNVVLVNRRALY